MNPASLDIVHHLGYTHVERGDSVMLPYEHRMVDIDDLMERILGACRPTRIYLFGSRATGRARPDSDVDLLVVWDEKPNLTPMSRQLMIGRFMGRLGYGLDLLVYTSDELEAALANPLSFASQSLREAVLLYG